MTLAADKELLG